MYRPCLLLLQALLFTFDRREFCVHAFHQPGMSIWCRISAASSITTGRPIYVTGSNNSDDDSSSSSSKDDEIAKLEEQLRKLKEEKSPTAALEATETVSTSVTAVADQKLEEEIPISMFLSEGWKEGDNNNGNNGTIQNKQNNAEADKGGIIGNLLKALGVVVVLIALSQIPVGQENLSKYSGSIKSGENPASTSIDLGDVNRVKNADL